MYTKSPPYTILVTGATGYLGSAICADLCRNHRIIGVYIKAPTAGLIASAPGVVWECGDVVETGCLECILKRAASRGHPVGYIIHLAAFTDYGDKWQDEYTDTNVIGTRNVIETACHAGVKRILFASSIAALEPPPEGMRLTEQTSVFAQMAYAKSKAMGETLLKENSARIPAVILRLGGVFTDWCELPPLFSLMNHWSIPFFGRLMPGQGRSGFPHIHRRDVIAMVRRIVEMDRELPPYEVLFASPPGATLQKDLFPIIRKESHPHFSTAPISVPPMIARAVLLIKYSVNTLMLKQTYERAWMIRYLDRPLWVDTAYTRNRLGWHPSPELHVLKKLPVLMKQFREHRREWIRRNINRNDQNYEYHPD